MHCWECEQVTRRKFLKFTGAGVGTMALVDPLLSLVASTYAQTSGGTGNLLVLCQLEGGLDALSVLAPYANPVYMANRPQLKLGSMQVTPLPGRPELGINTAFPFFSQMYAQGQCAIVQQVGYPNPNGSHFESQDIFELGVRNLAEPAVNGVSWYERLRRSYFNQPYGLLETRRIGDATRYGYPDYSWRLSGQEGFGRLASAKLANNRLSSTQRSLVEQYAHIDTTSADLRTRTSSFVSTGSARGEFYRAAQLASAGLGTQILKLRYGGFDTHGSQRAVEQTLFPRLNNEFQQFVADLQSLGLWDRTTIIFYSEFGRRNRENASPGTDHGWGGHMYLFGPHVRGGLYGQEPTSSDLQQNDLRGYVDFRAVFSACIRDWLGFDPRPIFQIGGESYDENVGAALFA